jgi:hypothetical protein
MAETIQKDMSVHSKLSWLCTVIVLFSFVSAGLASNIEFQRKIETQTDLIQHERAADQRANHRDAKVRHIKREKLKKVKTDSRN